MESTELGPLSGVAGLKEGCWAGVDGKLAELARGAHSDSSVAVEGLKNHQQGFFDRQERKRVIVEAI